MRGGVPVSFAAVRAGGGFVEVLSCAKIGN